MTNTAVYTLNGGKKRRLNGHDDQTRAQVSGGEEARASRENRCAGEWRGQSQRGDRLGVQAYADRQ